MSRPAWSRTRNRFGAVLLVIGATLALGAPGAVADPGYQLTSSPLISLGAEVPIGVAIDQSSQQIYVAELSKNLLNVTPGQVEQLTSSGAPTANSPFVTGGADLFSSVAVNPVTHGIYAYQAEGSTPSGYKGKSTISGFSSSGALGASFFPEKSAAGTLAADSSGRVYFPNDSGHSVQIFSSSGALEGTLTCSSCPGGGFVTPGAVAFDSSGHLYVVDKAGNGRVVELEPSGGTYVYASTLQTGGGAIAVAVDTSTNDVFVGNRVGSKYHVIAYDSSGTAFDDFGTELVTPSLVEIATGQMAVNATTHKLYLSSPGGNNLWVFERIASIPAPTASVGAPGNVGQVTAQLRATVNPKAHVLTTCHLEYTDHADFLANGWANADAAACPELVGNRESTLLSASVSGLSPSTSYDYRVQVGSFGGSAESGPQAFETLPALPPVVTTGTASSIAKKSATLTGSVNPKGGTISSCRFEYVTEAAFQASAFAGAAVKSCSTIPSGNATVAVAANVSGLAAGTTYRFRVAATNNTGMAQGTDQSFTTVPETCAENPAFCPPSGGGEPPQTTTPGLIAPAPAAVSTPQPKPLKCRKGFKKKRVRGKLRCVRVKKRPVHRR
jgi:hypothetical protein